MTAILRIEQINKSFGNLVVLRDVSFGVQAGEVVGLAGRSGAGKSTIIKILSGGETADSGSVTYLGRSMLEDNLSFQHEIGVINQSPSLANQLDATTNIFLGQERHYEWMSQWFRLPNQRKMVADATELLTRLDAPTIPVDETVGQLTAEQKQLIAIARVMVRPRKLILIDDPSPTLGIPYRQKLLGLVRGWQKEGAAILFSDNNLDNLFAVSDRVLVMREGRLVASIRTDETSREDVVAAMVGGERNHRTPMIWAMDSYYGARRQAEQLMHNQKLLERNLRDRDRLNRQLVGQLGEQVEALDSANLALQDAQRRLLTEREEERKHLAREIHDQAIQDLLSLNYELEEIESRMTAEQLVSEADIRDVRQSIRILVEDLRRICGNLRPPTIDSLGLPAALRSFARDWEERNGVQVSVELDSTFGRLPEAIELSIFRIVQESLNNIGRHAEATHAQVEIRSISPRLLLLTIRDDGRGMERGFELGGLGRDGHYGLLGISERVALLGGKFTVNSKPNQGVTVQVEIPHPKFT